MLAKNVNKAIIISLIKLLYDQLQRPISSMTLATALLLYNEGHGNSMVSGQRQDNQITLHIEAYSERGDNDGFSR